MYVCIYVCVCVIVHIYNKKTIETLGTLEVVIYIPYCTDNKGRAQRGK